MHKMKVVKRKQHSGTRSQKRVRLCLLCKLILHAAGKGPRARRRGRVTRAGLAKGTGLLAACHPGMDATNHAQYKGLNVKCSTQHFLDETILDETGCV